MNIPTRLNNPGDLRPTDSSQPTESTSSGNFRTFDTPGKGFEALLNDLQSKISGSTSTGLNAKSNLVDFANVYAPESDNNNSGQYAANLANQLKVRPDTTLGELQPRIGELAKAVATNEGYQWSDQNIDNSQPSETNNTPDAFETFLNGFTPGGFAAEMQKYPSAVLAGLAPLIPSLLGGLGIGGTAATVGGAAATTEAASPGLLSKALGFGKKAVEASALGYTGDKILNAVTGGNQQPQGQTQSPQNQNILTDLTPQINASKGAYNAYDISLKPTQNGRAFMQDPLGQETMLNASLSGRVPDTSSGFNDFTQAEKERAAEAKAMAKMESVIVGEGKLDTSEVSKIAKQHIPSNLTPKERAAVIKHIDSEVASYGKSVSLARGVEARHQQYRATRGRYGEAPLPSEKIVAHKAVAKGFREAVKNHTKHKDLYEKSLHHQQLLKNEQKLYKILDRKKSPVANEFNKSLHKFGTRLFATYVGDKIGGVVGAVVGNVILNIGQKAADVRFGKNVFDSPRVRAGLKVLKEELPSQYEIFKKEMEQKGLKFPKEDSEEGLIKDMKKGGVTRSEKILSGALKMSKADLIRQKNPGALMKRSRGTIIDKGGEIKHLLNRFPKST